MLIRPTKRSQIKLSAYSKILNIIKELKNDEDLQVSNRLALIWNDEKKPMEFNKENVRKVLESLPWFRRQIEEAMAETRSFFTN